MVGAGARPYFWFSSSVCVRGSILDSRERGHEAKDFRILEMSFNSKRLQITGAR